MLTFLLKTQTLQLKKRKCGNHGSEITSFLSLRFQFLRLLSFSLEQTQPVTLLAPYVLALWQSHLACERFSVALTIFTAAYIDEK